MSYAEHAIQLRNYTAIDLLGTVTATIVFALVFLPPGFVLGWASNVLGFRRRSATEKLLLSVTLSVAAVPVVSVLFARFVSITAVLALLLLLLLAALALGREDIFGGSRSITSARRSTWIAWGFVALWSVVACFSLVDLQFGERLYGSSAIFDQSVRIPLVESASRTGVPPINPFYGIAKPPVLRYYYYWSVICALPERLFGISARACFHASVLWSGFALAAIIPLFLKHFFEERISLRRKSLIGIFLLTVTGLDLIPYGLLFLRKHVLLADLEWWNPDQVTSWFDSLIWVPHHIAALIACMVGLLVLSTLGDRATTRERIWAAILAGLAFASTAGLSAYIAFVFAFFVVLWSVLLLAQRRISDFVTYVAAGALSLILSLPYLSDLRTHSVPGTQGSGSSVHGFPQIAVFATHSFPPVIRYLQQLGVRGPALTFAHVPILLFFYIMEFGFFLWIGVLQFKHELLGKAPLTQQRRAAWALLASSLLVVTILQSDPATTGGNDLGYRGTLLIQFILLLWAAPLLHNVFAKPNSSARSDATPTLGWSWKLTLACSLILGVLGTLCQLVVLRFYSPLADSGKIRKTEAYFGPTPDIGRRTYLLREGFTKIGDATPQVAQIQYNPVSSNRWLMSLYSTRQMTAGDEFCGSTFGGDPDECKKAMPYLVAAFNSPEEVRAWDIDNFCNVFRLNLLVATTADPVWDDTESWVWTRNPIVANDALRAIPCGRAQPERRGNSELIQ